MQTKNINHQHDPQGNTHQNCQLTNDTSLGMASNDRMYSSTGALYQTTDTATPNVNLSANVRDKSCDQTNSFSSSIPKLLSPLRSAANKSFRCHTSNTGVQRSGQSTSCTSTPLLSSGILRRQTSLGQLEGRTDGTGSRSQNGRNSETTFSNFQQKIRSMLLPAKESTKTRVNTNNMNDNPTESQTSQINQNSENMNSLQRTCITQNVTNNYSTIPSISQQNPEMDNSVEEENDSFHIRDVCSKWFGQKQSPLNQSFSSQMVSAVNKSSLSMDSPKLSHNMKSTLMEKVVTKDTICQNSYPNSSYTENSLVNGFASNQTITATETNQNINDLCERHVVVVSGLECDTNSNSLTVRSDVMSPEINPLAISSHTNGISIQTHTSVNKLQGIHESVESISSPDHNYKSSSDSGRGTDRSRLQIITQNSCSDGISPLDSTSLDSDQSNGIPANVWDNQNRTVVDSRVTTVSSNDTIVRMQRELQRILEDNQSVPSIEVEELSRSFQTRLSVVNESDSWTSNTPSQTPQPHQKSTSVKYCESKADTKYSTNGLNVSSKTFNTNKPKQSYVPNDRPINTYNKPKIVSEKSKYPALKNSRTPQLLHSTPKRKTNERSVYVPNKPKLRSHSKSKDRFIQSIDCDIVSTTTARDSNYDELSSEYTANTSLCGRNTNNSYALRKQLQSLENMYSEMIGMLGSRRKGDSYRSRRKLCRSTSSVISGRSSVTSRGTRDLYSKRSKPESRHKYEDNHLSRRIKRLESHVITLARSVSQISTDMRYNHSLSEEMDNLRQDVDLIRNQLMSLKQNISPNGFSVNTRAHHSSNGQNSIAGKRNPNHIINPNKVEKLKRFFGDEPPLLRQFLKKLGYEKYARNFESEKIGITELPYLSEERMQKLGIPLGPRMRILQESHSQLKTIVHNSNNDNYSIYAIV